MGSKRKQATEDLWAQHQSLYRDPHQIAAQWILASEVDPKLLVGEVRGDWWQTLDEAGITLLVTREYEHLVMALGVKAGKPRVSYLHVPHPNGLAIDHGRQIVYLASTRNPNVIYELAPCAGFLGTAREHPAHGAGMLLPRTARFLPGRLYLHDLALIGSELYGTAVGLNAIVRLRADGGFEPVWWPRCIDSDAGPRFDKNYLQLNAIAAGPNLAESYFTASAAVPSRRRPGQRNFPVDGRGVVFSGQTRQVAGTGLTRPHSLRFHAGELWVQNSGYGQLGRMLATKFEPVVALPGWTRGLCFHGNLAFAGTSRVIPRFRQYAPGVPFDRSECAVHAIDLKTGTVRGSLTWPSGNQIFGIEAIDRAWTDGFGFTFPPARSAKAANLLFFNGLSPLDC
jgi:uncharacterized protein (TIGR03032 family)